MRLYRILFTWEFLERYLSFFKRSASVSYQAFWEVTIECYLIQGCASLDDLQTLINYRKYFQDAVVCYIILMKIDWSNMCCACDGKNGRVVDGTQVGYKSLSSLLVENWRVPPAGSSVKAQTPPGVLSFFSGAPPRQIELLEKFIRVYQRRDKKNNKRFINAKAGLELDEFQELLHSVQNSQHARVQLINCLLHFEPEVRTVQAKKGNSTHQFHHPNQIVKNLLTALVSGYPVQSLVPASSLRIRRELLGESSWTGDKLDSTMTELRAVAPIIYEFMFCCNSKDIQGVKSLLSELCNMTCSAFAASVPGFGVGSDAPQADSNDNYNTLLPGEANLNNTLLPGEANLNNTLLPGEANFNNTSGYTGALPAFFAGEEDYFATGHFYPNLPVKRFVPQYEKDKAAKSRTACNKFIRCAGKSTPGLFLCFCKKHGKLIGFHAMKYSESVRTVHNLLYSRFTRAPSIIIYDNCCNLHMYALAREPDFYNNTLFVIDRLHENSHGTCSPAYSCDRYVQLRDTNTQIAEQKNSLYVQKRAQLYAMGHFMFLFHLRYYTWACAGHSRIKVT